MFLTPFKVAIVAVPKVCGNVLGVEIHRSIITLQISGGATYSAQASSSIFYGQIKTRGFPCFLFLFLFLFLCLFYVTLL
jgi:hypothetical protein